MNSTERRSAILQRGLFIDAENHFERLALPLSATAEQVQLAYLQLVRDWHPDRLPRELVDLKETCARVFARLSEARAVLADDAQRAQYLRDLECAAGVADEAAHVQRVLDATHVFARASAHLKRCEWEAALRLCREAFELDPTQGDYLASMAWAEAHQMPNGDVPAIRAKISVIDRALAMHPRSTRALYYRAILRKRIGLVNESMADFGAILAIDPRHIDAAREVRLHASRDERVDARGALAGARKLFNAVLPWKVQQ